MSTYSLYRAGSCRWKEEKCVTKNRIIARSALYRAPPCVAESSIFIRFNRHRQCTGSQNSVSTTTSWYWFNNCKILLFSRRYFSHSPSSEPDAELQNTSRRFPADISNLKYYELSAGITLTPGDWVIRPSSYWFEHNNRYKQVLPMPDDHLPFII